MAGRTGSVERLVAVADLLSALVSHERLAGGPSLCVLGLLEGVGVMASRE